MMRQGVTEPPHLDEAVTHDYMVLTFFTAGSATIELESRWSVFGDRDSVPDNIAADEDEYREPFGGLAYWRSDWEMGGRIDARGGGEERWRLRGALGKAVRLGSGIKAYVQAEYAWPAVTARLQATLERLVG